MPESDHADRLAALEQRSDADRLCHAHLELQVSKLDRAMSALIRAVQTQREQREDDVDPRTERAARVAALEWSLAAAIGGTVDMNLALAVQMVISGESAPPAGYERLVVELRSTYARPPCVRTIWNHLQRHRRRLETSEPTSFHWPGRW
jgi:hypothetical protein